MGPRWVIRNSHMHPDDTRPVQVSTTHGVIDASTPLFQLTLEVPQLSVNDWTYPNAWLALLRTSDSPSWYSFERLILDFTPGMEPDYGAIFLMQDCFTWEELAMIQNCFECYAWPGATLVHERVCLPVPCSTLPTLLLHRPSRSSRRCIRLLISSSSSFIAAFQYFSS